MVSFGKNRDDKSAKKHRHRYDLQSIADDGIADVLLTDENQAPLAAALVEPAVAKGEEVIYELVIEERPIPTPEPEPEHEEQPQSLLNKTIPVASEHQAEEVLQESEPAPDADLPESLSDQVAKLCNEYQAIHKQLETSLAASNALTKQLETSKKQAATHHLTLGVAGLALLLGIVATVVTVSIQRDVTDLKDSLAALENQTATTDKAVVLKIQEVEGRVGQLNTKVDEVFTADNLENVLEVTKELRKQIHALTNKSTAISSLHSHSAREHEKADKAGLSDTNDSSKDLPTTHKKSSHKSPSKVDAVKKAQDDKLALANKWKKAEKSTDDVKAKANKLAKHQQAVSKTLKDKPEDKNHANHTDKH
jgi:hypothetical protein